MTDEQIFTDLKPLEYYYLHGYKLMNPFCRILSENPQYRFILEWRNLKYVGENNSRQVLADSITIKALMTLKKSLDSKTWDLLGLDELTVKSVLTGDAEDEYQSMVDGYRSMGVTTGLSDRTSILAHSRKTARDKLGALWRLLIDTRSALAAAQTPICTWLIRGDTSGMIRYLATQGVVFPEASAAASACRFDVIWPTNQFFSTSVGDELASLAGKALVWLIRINPGATQGRSGGLYTSEAEVLFPYDVRLMLNGVVSVSSAEQIEQLGLDGFDEKDKLRQKLMAVYVKNKRSWPNGKAMFLIATE